ncbi:ankyrin repeat and SOCS box protein 17 [Lepisosteus oculatus]|uniref:ankyrin repeat and SOCS box protein 17 n=1 Tax=Lepisosteus oculatus TaxID=7918 RepID=UPI00371D7FC7
MSNRDKVQPGISEPENKNVFLDLLSRVTQRVPYRFPGQWGYQSYEPRIYRTLAKIMRQATALEFKALLTDYVDFVRTEDLQLDEHFALEFAEICINTILYWVFARRGNPDLVKTLLDKTTGYPDEQTDNLALLWRPFTPVYSPSPLSGVTPLNYIAQTRQHRVLKVLMQYGLLEKERCPAFFVFTIMFYPPRLQVLDELDLANIMDGARRCIVLCTRVLTHISVSAIEAQVSLGRMPLVPDWRDCIPVNRYRDPCELSHLCRVTLRAWLLMIGSRNLPASIKALPLPAALQNFLNLES